ARQPPPSIRSIKPPSIHVNALSTRYLELAPANWRQTRERLVADELMSEIGPITVPPPLTSTAEQPSLVHAVSAMQLRVCREQGHIRVSQIGYVREDDRRRRQNVRSLCHRSGSVQVSGSIVAEDDQKTVPGPTKSQ
ncbi:MAG TPA: hypothetical protein VIV60_24315, partial [Polyangiaceae bacterium]